MQSFSLCRQTLTRPTPIDYSVIRSPIHFPVPSNTARGTGMSLFRVDNLRILRMVGEQSLPDLRRVAQLRALSSGPRNTQDECGHPSSLSGASPTSNILPVVPRNLIGTFDFKHLEIFAHIDVIDFYSIECIGQVP